MSVGAIPNALASAPTETTKNRFAELSSDDFIKVMLSSLKNQDPFKPQDSAALLEQLSSLRNIESQLKLQEQIESLVLQNQIASAGGLIGKVVSGLDQFGGNVSGLVTSVRVKSDEVFLELDSGQTLKADHVTEISELPDA